MSSADETIPRATEVSPRPAALLVPAALRYAAGRATGVSDYPVSLAYALAARLTPHERRRIIEAAIGAAMASAANRNNPSMFVSGESERLTELVDTLESLDGPGSDEPLQAGSGRTLALVANSALRFTSSPWSAEVGDEPAEHPALCLAVLQLAPEFRASDRVLVLRDLAEAAEDWRRSTRDGEPARTIPDPFVELYAELLKLPLDDDYARMNRLPASIALAQARPQH